MHWAFYRPTMSGKDFELHFFFFFLLLPLVGTNWKEQVFIRYTFFVLFWEPNEQNILLRSSCFSIRWHLWEQDLALSSAGPPHLTYLLSAPCSCPHSRHTDLLSPGSSTCLTPSAFGHLHALISVWNAFSTPTFCLFCWRSQPLV